MATSNPVQEVLGIEESDIVHEVNEKGKIVHVKYKKIYKTNNSMDFPDDVSLDYQLYDITTKDGYCNNYRGHYFIFTYRKVFEQ